jgi:protein-disulfide isomerase
VAVIGIFLISGARTSFPMTSLPRRAARDLQALAASPVALLVAVLFVATAASALAFFPREEHAASAGEAAAAAPQATQDQRSEFERYYMNLPRVQVPVNGEGATVVIVKFHDFQCPACAKAYFEYRKIFAKYQAEKPGAVKLVEKDFPLEMECNSTMQSSMHAAACEAAVAVRLARQKGKGAEMEDWLFVNQEKMTPAMVRQGVRDVGGVTDFDDQYPKVIDQVKADIALARLLDVRATPTFFINGTKVDGGFPPQYFEQAIELELKKVAQAKP